MDAVPELMAAEPVPSVSTPELDSSTMAELYFNQGFTDQAIEVYRRMAQREPGNARVEARLSELTALHRHLEADAAPAAPPAPAPAGRPDGDRRQPQSVLERQWRAEASSGAAKGEELGGFAEALTRSPRGCRSAAPHLMRGGIPCRSWCCPGPQLEAVRRSTALLRAAVRRGGHRPREPARANGRHRPDDGVARGARPSTTLRRPRPGGVAGGPVASGSPGCTSARGRLAATGAFAVAIVDMPSPAK